jgi:predicted  nucleic acid-binding Zn-ribbon protein
VETYINANGRLQGLPSADSVAQHGLDLGNTQAKLLEKIEQLTLYTIDLQKQVEDLQKQAEQLKAANEKFASLQQQIDELKEKKH